MNVFFHIAAVNNFREVVADVASAIDHSGLYDEADSLTANVAGEGDLADLLGVRWEVRQGSRLDEYEYSTLRLLHHDCSLLAPETPVLYVHTKGISYPKGPRLLMASEWRRYMLHWVVARWRESVKLLLVDEFDAVGAALDGSQISGDLMFCGNFWWARAGYLASLPDPFPTHPLYQGSKYRFWAEHWLLHRTRNYFCWHRMPESYRAWYRRPLGEFYRHE